MASSTAMLIPLFPPRSLLCYDDGCPTFAFFFSALRLFWYYLQSRFTGSETRLPMSGPAVVFVHVQGSDTHKE